MLLSKLRLAMPLRSIPFRLRVTALRQPRHVKILAPSSETEAAIENPKRPNSTHKHLEKPDSGGQ